jgi:hypothetical protein
VPEPTSGPLAQQNAAGTVSPPTGEFGPALAPPEESADDSYTAPEWTVSPAPETLAPAAAPEPRPAFVPVAEDEDSGPRPAPVREFAVAEAVMDPEETEQTEPSPLAEPIALINDAVKTGRIVEAAELSELTVVEATASLGAEHPEVLRLRELTAYIAYLAGDALRSFHLSLDLARLRHRLGDPRAAYGNVQSAAAAWRAVRDPLQGLHLGRDLLEVWTEVAAGAGPAAEDIEQLESARTRMGRLAERARALDENPYAGSPRAQGQ